MTNQEAIEFLSQIKDFLLANNSWLPSTDNPIKESFGMAINALEGKDINVPSKKGVFIPDITVEMCRNASLIGIEDLMASGEMEDISLPSAQPEEAISVAWLEEQAKWFESMDNAFAKIEANNIRVMIKKYRREKNE